MLDGVVDRGDVHLVDEAEGQPGELLLAQHVPALVLAEPGDDLVRSSIVAVMASLLPRCRSPAPTLGRAAGAAAGLKVPGRSAPIRDPGHSEPVPSRRSRRTCPTKGSTHAPPRTPPPVPVHGRVGHGPRGGLHRYVVRHRADRLRRHPQRLDHHDGRQGQHPQGPRRQGRRDRVQQDPQRLAQDQGLQGRPGARRYPRAPREWAAGHSSTRPARSSPSPAASA